MPPGYILRLFPLATSLGYALWLCPEAMPSGYILRLWTLCWLYPYTLNTMLCTIFPLTKWPFDSAFFGERILDMYVCVVCVTAMDSLFFWLCCVGLHVLREQSEPKSSPPPPLAWSPQTRHMHFGYVDVCAWVCLCVNLPHVGLHIQYTVKCMARTPSKCSQLWVEFKHVTTLLLRLFPWDFLRLCGAFFVLFSFYVESFESGSFTACWSIDLATFPAEQSFSG